MYQKKLQIKVNKIIENKNSNNLYIFSKKIKYERKKYISKAFN